MWRKIYQISPDFAKICNFWPILVANTRTIS